MESAGDDPELFGAASGGVNHFRMAAGKRDIFFIANEENGKSAGSDSFHRRDFRDGKTSELFVAIEQRPGAWSEKSFAEPGIFSQTGIVVGSFAEIGEGSFGDDGFDARISGGGLQDDARAHGFAEGENVRRPCARGTAGPRPLHGNARFQLGGNQGVDDGACIIALEPAVGGDGTAAGAMRAGVHHDDAVAGAQQEFRLTDDSNAVVGDAVEEEDPTAVGIFRADFPAAEKRSIRSFHVEVLASSAGGGEARGGFADEIGCQLAADRMEERGGSKPSGHGRQDRREEQQNQSDTN